METIRVSRSALEKIGQQALMANGLRQDAAKLAIQILIEADIRGIPSHGLARLPRYLKSIREQGVSVTFNPTILRETPVSIAIDANNAMGTTAANYAMQQVIQKANQNGIGIATVCNSNHFGIAGWYAMQALSSDLIGIAMTNTSALGLPTFGQARRFGSNPIAFAAPANKEHAFVLDMATTAVANGKIEVYARQQKPLPEGWGDDANSHPLTEASQLLATLAMGNGGGLHPLGGKGELFGGHKGYGLAIMVDILCGVLSGNAFGQHIVHTPLKTGNVGHFFAALQVELFRDKAVFKHEMDNLLFELRSTPPCVGEQRVWYAGLKELTAQQEAAKWGVPLEQNIIDSLHSIAQYYHIESELNYRVSTTEQ